jgi:hypothetical protein
VRGVSAQTRALLKATVARQAGGHYRVTGTVAEPGHPPQALDGSTAVSGPLSEPATWIVLPNGRVKGASKATSCSTWASLKEAMFGVHCGFF